MAEPEPLRASRSPMQRVHMTEMPLGRKTRMLPTMRPLSVL